MTDATYGILTALILNCAVLVPVLWGLVSSAPWAVDGYGTDTSARRILTAVYAAILCVSLILFVLIWNEVAAAVHWAMSLMSVQIIYKLITVPLIGPAHPVARANLAIAVFHGAILLWAF